MTTSTNVVSASATTTATKHKTLSALLGRLVTETTGVSRDASAKQIAQLQTGVVLLRGKEHALTLVEVPVAEPARASGGRRR